MSVITVLRVVVARAFSNVIMERFATTTWKADNNMTTMGVHEQNTLVLAVDCISPFRVEASTSI